MTTDHDAAWTRAPLTLVARDLWRGTAAVRLLPSHPSLPGRLRWWARTRPEAAAFTDAAGTLTWRQLDLAVDELARLIDHRDRLTVSIAGSRETWLVALAGLRAGARVRLRNPRLGPDASASSLVVRDVGDLPRERAVQHRRRLGAGRLVVHTSGSTGHPVAVRTRWGLGVALQQLGLIGRLPLRHARTVGVMLPLDRGHGFGTAAYCLAAGRHLVDLRHSGVALDHTRVDVITCLPEQLERLIEVHPGGLRAVVCGSEPLDVSLAARVSSELGVDVWNCYGTTQTGTVCVAGPDERAVDPMSVGRPLPLVSVRERDGVIEVRSPQSRDGVAHDRGRVVDGLVAIEGRVPHGPASSLE